MDGITGGRCQATPRPMRQESRLPPHGKGKIRKAQDDRSVCEIFFPEEFRPSHYLVW